MKKQILFKREQDKQDKSVSIPYPKRSNTIRKKGIPIEDVPLTVRGTIIVIYNLLIGDPFNDKPKNAMKRFCHYLEQQGYGESTNDIFAKLVRMNKKQGEKWIKSVFKKYVNDDTQLLEFVMNGEEVTTGCDYTGYRDSDWV